MQPNDLEHVGLDGVELRAARGLNAVLPLQPHGHAQIHELEQIEIGRGLLQETVEDLEKLLAAPALIVKDVEQRLIRPDALAAPGRVQDGLVEQRAQGVARRDHGLRTLARRLRGRFEVLDLLRDLSEQPTGIGVVDRGAEARREPQQRRRGPRERIHVGGVRALQGAGRRRGAEVSAAGCCAASRRGRGRSRALPAAGRRPQHSAVAAPEERVVGHDRIAQNCMSRPRYSPLT